MFTLLRVLPVRRLVIEQLPSFTFAWLTAEVFFKFHSFTLELFAFLFVWAIVDAAIQGLSALISRRTARSSRDYS